MRRRKSSRPLLYRVLVALPLTLALSFGLSLWQTNGGLLRASFWRWPSGVSFSNPFAVTIASAAGTCDSAANPAAPPNSSYNDGNGHLYYNSCAGKFRAYQGVYPGSAWVDLGLWRSGGNFLYNTNPGQVFISTVGAAGYPSLPTSTNSARDVLVLNVDTSSANYIPSAVPSPGESGAVLLTNALGFGLWSTADSSWADLLAGTITASKVCLPNASSSSNCVTSWQQVTGTSTFWAYATANDSTSPIKNTNQVSGNPSGAITCSSGGDVVVSSKDNNAYIINIDQGNSATDTLTIYLGQTLEQTVSPLNTTSKTALLAVASSYVSFLDDGCNGYLPATALTLTTSGGDVEVTSNLAVDRSVHVYSRNNSSSGIWTDNNSGSNPTDLAGQGGCTGAGCGLRTYYVNPFDGGKQLLLGDGGMLLQYQGGRAWNVLVNYGGLPASGLPGAYNVVTLTDDNTIYTIDPTQTPGVGGLLPLYKYNNSGGWARVWPSSTPYAPTTSQSLMFSFPGSAIGTSVYYTYSATSLGVFRNNGFSPRGVGALLFNSLPTSVAPLQNSSFYMTSNSFNNTYFTSPGFRYFQLSSSGLTMTQQDYATFYGGSSGTTRDFNIAITPKVIAADYNQTSCSSCVVVVGSRASFTGATSTNILIGDGSGNATNWFVPSNFNFSDGSGPLNNDAVIFTSAWVGNGGQNIIVSGTDSRSGGTAVAIMALSFDGGNHWAVTKPTEPNTGILACQSSPCLPYVVSGGTYGGSYNFFTADYVNRIYYKGVDVPSGTLTVDGQFNALNTKWPVGGNKCVTPGQDGAIQTCSGSKTRCPNGYYMVGTTSAGQVECASL